MTAEDTSSHMVIQGAWALGRDLSTTSHLGAETYDSGIAELSDEQVCWVLTHNACSDLQARGPYSSTGDTVNTFPDIQNTMCSRLPMKLLFHLV